MAPKTKYRAASIARGAIVWLPNARFIKTALPGLPADVFDHPVLIYSIPEPGEVDVLLVTSFKAGESLIGRFQTDADFRSRQLPIHPAPRHPDNGILLTLQDGRVWPRQSYVSVSLFRVPVAALRKEQQGPWSVCPESMRALDGVVGGLSRLPSGMGDGEEEGGGGWEVVSRKRRRSSVAGAVAVKGDAQKGAARL
ncbi:hypothetical protein BT67DRAFT_427855 [Trichocladium antarcticum]|uniref:Uncharacterized protein n=1 Tax=Trichocladium antarcticum TaxID=1450529 RepID=A0AAN6UE43_9PEZI|nr:hypothetical protein BT67DRAFT_427855 [Trichocladium antarcticum]